MSKSIKFRIKPEVDIEKYGILELFFKAWIDDVYHNQVYYSNGVSLFWDKDINTLSEVINIEFINPEDAVVMKLTGIPEEFKNYLELIH